MATKKKVKEVAKVAERPDTIAAGVNVNNYLPSTDTNLVGKNQYIGMRYVPRFFGDWNSLESYEPLSIVDWTDEDGNKGQYVSKWFTTIGKDPSNEDEWLEIFNFTPAFNDLVKKVNENYSTLDGKIDSEKEELNEKITNNQNAITEEAQNRAEADRQTNANVTTNKNEIDALDLRVETIEDTIQSIPSADVLSSLASDVDTAKTNIESLKDNSEKTNEALAGLDFEIVDTSGASAYKNNATFYPYNMLIIKSVNGKIVKTLILLKLTNNKADLIGDRAYKFLVIPNVNPYNLSVVNDTELNSLDDIDSKLFKLGYGTLETTSNESLPFSVLAQFDGTNTYIWAEINIDIDPTYNTVIDVITLNTGTIIKNPII